MKAIIIAPEQGTREALLELLRVHCRQVELVGQAADGAEGLALIRQVQPALAFWEAEALPTASGELREAISAADTTLVVLASSGAYAALAFELDALAYLPQPVDAHRVVHAVQKAQERWRLRAIDREHEWIAAMLKKQEFQAYCHQRFAFSNQQEVFFICLKDLIRIEADGNCSHIYATECPDGMLVSKNIGEFSKVLEGVPFFFQPHRSHLVNLLHIKKIIKKEGGIAIIQIDGNGTEASIPVAQRCKEKLNERLKNLWQPEPSS